jgi:hypothetical protein
MEQTIEQKMNSDIEKIIGYLEQTKKIHDYEAKIDAVHRANHQVNGFTFHWQDKLDKTLKR